MQGKTSVKVRLDGIDAPETGQGFGTKAKQALSGKILARTVRVKTTGTDRYGRTLGVVWLGDRNINFEMVAEGWAWHFKKYSKDHALADAENQARAKKAGLWADEHPIAPWDWRLGEKERRQETGIARATADPSVPALPKSAAEPKSKSIEKPVEKSSSDDSDKAIVYITKSGKKYHSAGCSYLAKSSIPISLADAKNRGYTPCSKCGGIPTKTHDESDHATDTSTTYTGPRGGHYHYSKSGKKVYEKK
jgi:hypothetical protein